MVVLSIGGIGMEDKTFELLEKMYSDFSSRFDRIETDITIIKKRCTNLEG